MWPQGRYSTFRRSPQHSRQGRLKLTAGRGSAFATDVNGSVVSGGTIVPVGTLTINGSLTLSNSGKLTPNFAAAASPTINLSGGSSCLR